MGVLETDLLEVQNVSPLVPKFVSPSLTCSRLSDTSKLSPQTLHRIWKFWQDKHYLFM